MKTIFYSHTNQHSILQHLSSNYAERRSEKLIGIALPLSSIVEDLSDNVNEA